MTPKEKAEELINKFTKECEFNCQPSTVKGIAKKSALICVGEITKELDDMEKCETGLIINSLGQDEWDLVKQEINKL